jgi:hypothetical protein
VQVRFPEFDLDAAGPQWGDHRGAVAVVNAGVIIPAALERYDERGYDPATIAPPRDYEMVLAQYA